MRNVFLGVNLEFVRHADKPFEWAVAKAAELGYEYVEPMLHWGRELLSEAGYFHSVSMLDDPLRVRRACEKAGVKLSGFSAHAPLCKPEISTEYLKQAVRFAAECGAPVVNTDEGPKPSWTTPDEDHLLMRYVLREAAAVAEPRGVLIGIEPHQQYSGSPAGLDRICRLVDSPAIGINFDTGNSYLCGHDPIAWLEHVVDRLVHLHAKDISGEQSEAQRGKVTGTPSSALNFAMPKSHVLRRPFPRSYSPSRCFRMNVSIVLWATSSASAALAPIFLANAMMGLRKRASNRRQAASRAGAAVVPSALRSFRNVVVVRHVVVIGPATAHPRRRSAARSPLRCARCRCARRCLCRGRRRSGRRTASRPCRPGRPRHRRGRSAHRRWRPIPC